MLSSFKGRRKTIQKEFINKNKQNTLHNKVKIPSERVLMGFELFIY